MVLKWTALLMTFVSQLLSSVDIHAIIRYDLPFSPHPLMSLVGMQSIKDATTVDDVTDAEVLSWLDRRIGEPAEEIADRIDGAVEEVRWVVHHYDPHGSALDVFVNVHTALRKNRMGDAIHDNGKQLIELVVPKIQSNVARDTIKRDMRFWKSEDKKGFGLFIERVTKVGNEAARYRSRRPGDNGGASN
jgi:hypothetical protein